MRACFPCRPAQPHSPVANPPARCLLPRAPSWQMIASWGWASVFYIFGAAGLVWYLWWGREAAATPREDPRISEVRRLGLGLGGRLLCGCAERRVGGGGCAQRGAAGALQAGLHGVWGRWAAGRACAAGATRQAPDTAPAPTPGPAPAGRAALHHAQHRGLAPAVRHPLAPAALQARHLGPHHLPLLPQLGHLHPAHLDAHLLQPGACLGLPAWGRPPPVVWACM